MKEQLLDISPEFEIAAKEEQRLKCEEMKREMEMEMAANFSMMPAINDSFVRYCSPSYDGRLCWLKTMQNTTVTVPCPQFINGFINDTRGNYGVSRQCNLQGIWEWIPDHDYTFCGEALLQWHSVLLWLRGHLDTVSWIYTVGYCICLGPLLASVLVLLAFRRLRCPRNYIHVNFFASVIFQFITSLVKDILAPTQWIKESPNDTFKLLSCRFVYVSSYYFSSTTCAWTFVEGLYLYILMFSTSAVEQNIWKKLMAVGWGAPFIFVLGWGICRYFVDNTECWSSHFKNSYVFYVLKLPNVGMISCTFFFFIRIFITLLHKLRADSTARRPTGMATRMVKSTLALIVLFGVPYITFAFMPDNEIPFTRLNLIKWHKALVIKLYFEFTFQVIQALALVALFCFGNNEVQKELVGLFRHIRILIFGDNEPRRSRTGTTSVTRVTTPPMSMNANGAANPALEDTALLDTPSQAAQTEAKSKEIEQSKL